MTAVIYRDAGFGGPFAVLPPGFYADRALQGCPHMSTSCEDLARNVGAVRVDPNTLCVLSDGLTPAAGRRRRVLVGPADVPDLAALGLAGRLLSVQVLPFRAYDGAAPALGAGVTLFAGYGGGGRPAHLRRGDYTPARLASEEVGFRFGATTSAVVAAHTVAVFYERPDFDPAGDALLVAGPAAVDDLGASIPAFAAVRVLYTDPFDTPDRPAVPFGVARLYAASAPPPLWGASAAAGLGPAAAGGDAGGSGPLFDGPPFGAAAAPLPAAAPPPAAAASSPAAAPPDVYRAKKEATYDAVLYYFLLFIASALATAAGLVYGPRLAAWWRRGPAAALPLAPAPPPALAPALP
jgi:hypothetical protein